MLIIATGSDIINHARSTRELRVFAGSDVLRQYLMPSLQFDPADLAQAISLFCRKPGEVLKTVRQLQLHACAWRDFPFRKSCHAKDLNQPCVVRLHSTDNQASFSLIWLHTGKTSVKTIVATDDQDPEPSQTDNRYANVICPQLP